MARKMNKKGVVAFRVFGISFTRNEVRQMPKRGWLELHRNLHDAVARAMR